MTSSDASDVVAYLEKLGGSDTLYVCWLDDPRERFDAARAIAHKLREAYAREGLPVQVSAQGARVIISLQPEAAACP